MNVSTKSDRAVYSGLLFSIVTVSDRCSAGSAVDISGAELQRLIKEQQGTVIDYSVLPDNADDIASKLHTLVEQGRAHIILTTGGTGFAPRDVTPEATLRVIEKRAQGLETAMTTASLKKTPFGMLSRAVCGISKKTLIINLPGSRKGAVECFQAVGDIIPHAVALIRDNVSAVEKTHNGVQMHFSGAVSQVHCDVIGRPRQSKWEMVDDKEALRIIVFVIDKEYERKTEHIILTAARGRALHEPIFSPMSIPACDVSIKDGYAVRSADLSEFRKVVNHSEPASNVDEFRSLGEGECIRVTTGAPLPSGADSVVQVEDTELVECDVSKNEEKIIKLKIKPHVGLDVRKSGSDVQIGQKIAGGKDALNAVNLARIASLGQTQVCVYKKPVVAVMSTGNEIIDVFSTNERGKPGTVIDSNRIMLISMLEKNGYRVVDLGIARDTPQQILEKLRFGLSQADVIVSSGGVSMGEKDFLKPVLETDLKATIHFGRINMKPGKPTTFASVKWENMTKFVFALPGNPTSSLATSILYLFPALRLMEGVNCFNQTAHIRVRAREAPYKLDARPEFYRSTLTYCNGLAEVIVDKPHASSNLGDFSQTTILARLPSISEADSSFLDHEKHLLLPVYFISQYV